MATSKRPQSLAMLALFLPLFGCVPSPLLNFSDTLATAILNQNDVTLVREALPAYLLMTDGLIEKSPEDSDLLMSGAKLYAFYAVEMLDDKERSLPLTQKARGYAYHALCLKHTSICNAYNQSFDDFVIALKEAKTYDLNALYTFSLTLAAWLKTRSKDWGAIAEKPKIEALFERVLELDESFDHGRAHYYLAILRSQLPPSLGGKPDEGKFHFERALAISDNRDLATKVAFAQYFARMTYDRSLHDRLLTEVLAADPAVTDLFLSNTLAQQEARKLLEESQHYFQE